MVKKYDSNDISIRLQNLAKKIGFLNVYTEIEIQKNFTDDICDAMNLAYYSLKNKYSKINREKYGRLNAIYYKPKYIKYVDSNWYYDTLANRGYMVSGTSNNYTIPITYAYTTAANAL